MEEELAMLRHLIGHFQELFDLFGSTTCTTPTTAVTTTALDALTPSLLSRHHHQHHHFQQFSHRPCFLELDESNPMKLNCTDVNIKPEKPTRLKMLGPQMPPPTKKPRKAQNCTLPLGATANTSEPMMDEHVWREFPEDLLEAVVARLPIASFFRLRAVCKKWNSLLHAQGFSYHCSQLAHRPSPWFFAITHGDLNAVLYDPTSRTWRQPPSPPALVTKKGILLPTASAGGLVCFLDIQHSCIFVCNPLTQTWKQLPPHLLRLSCTAVGMSLIPPKKGGGVDIVHYGYNILWVDKDGNYEMYDSETNSWACRGRIPEDIIRSPVPRNFRSQIVAVDTTIYFLRSAAAPEGGLMWYDVLTGMWGQVAVPFPPNTVDHALAESEGKVLLVGLVTRNAATCVCVWELQRMTLLWKEVDRMPNVWCLEFYGKHVRMTCLGNRGLIMLSLKSRQMSRIIMYDVVTGEWSKVPECSVPEGCGGNGWRKREGVAFGTAFYPSLTAIP